MRWEDQRRSDNVEDRRGMKVSRGVGVGGIGTVVIVLLISWITGANPLHAVPTRGWPWRRGH